MMEITLQIQDENDLKWLLPFLEKCKIPFSKKTNVLPIPVLPPSSVKTDPVLEQLYELVGKFISRETREINFLTTTFVEIL